jgi:hypothetical protein
MATHASLSPSAADRWFNCPGSVYLCEGIPSTQSAHAAEGTQAHAVAEALLNGTPYDAPEEMYRYVKVYVDHIEELCDYEFAILHTEASVRVNEKCWGTCDAAVWRPDEKTLYIRDLKYGAGVTVEANSLQLKIYALAAMLTFKYPATVINVGIVQPRINHPDGVTRSKDYDVVDLIEFHAELLDAMKRVNTATYLMKKKTSAQEYLIPTEKGCRWCAAAPTCPKIKATAQLVAKQVFTHTHYDPRALSNTLDQLPIMEAWIKNVREFAYAEAEKGNVIPNYKLVPKQASRKWKQDVSVADMAKVLGVKEYSLFKEPELKGVTEIQKLAPGKNDAERAGYLQDFTVKESSGHTLVHESDKREAIRVDAKAAFAE